MKAKFILLIVIFSTRGWTQEILQYPSKFVKPVCQGLCDNFLDERSKEVKNSYWTVVSDRDDNVSYNKPETKSGVKKNIQFGEVFYVVEERNGWIKLSKGTRIKGKKSSKVGRNNEDYGWIPKRNLLMWNYPLVDDKTKVSKKVILLNTVNSVVSSSSENNAPLFMKPSSSSNSTDSRSLYDFYYIMKEVDEFYLLSSSFEVNDLDVEKKLIGWIDKNNCTVWKTRVAVEPNYTNEAFAERKEGKRVVGFSSLGKAVKYANEGIIDGVSWDDDPVQSKTNRLRDIDCKLGGNRYEGSVVRFPVLSNQKAKAKGVIRSGVIATYPKSGNTGGGAGPGAGLVKKLDKIRSNTNLYFLVEKDANQNIGSIIKEVCYSIQESKPPYIKTIQYGLGHYSNEEDGGNITIGKLSPDYQNFVSKVDALTTTDTDDNFSVVNKALQKTMQRAEFQEEANNILIVIGENGDLSSHPLLRKKYSSSLVDVSSLVSQISEKKINVIGVQPKNLDSNSSRRFRTELRGLLVQTANTSFSSSSSVLGDAANKIPNPSYDDVDDNPESHLRGGVISSGIKRPSTNKALSAKGISSFIEKIVIESFERSEKLYSEFYKVMIKGDELDMDPSAGSWPAGFVEVLIEACKDLNGEDYDCGKWLNVYKGKRYKIFNEVKFPSRLHDAEHDPFTYVAFIEEDELRSHRDVLRQLEQAYNDPADKQREALYEGFRKMLENYSGGDFTKEDLEKSSADDVLEKALGLSAEIGSKYFPSYLIGDIDNKKKMPDNLIENEIKRLNKLVPKISNILRQGSDYCFVYRPPGSDFLYYWMPLDMLF